MKQRLTTPWGDLETWVTAQEGLSVTCSAGPVSLTLPPHIKVDDCLGVVWRIAADEETAGVAVHAEWMDLPDGAVGGADNGEHLDAMTWNLGRATLSLGTQDGERLRERAHTGRAVPAHWTKHLALGTVQHTSTGLVVPLPAFRKGDAVSLHFLVAWQRTSTAKDPWTWFAVDQPHEHVVASIDDAGGRS